MSITQLHLKWSTNGHKPCTKRKCTGSGAKQRCLLSPTEMIECARQSQIDNWNYFAAALQFAEILQQSGGSSFRLNTEVMTATNRKKNNFSNHRKLTNLKRTTCSLQKWRILPHWVGQQEFQRHKRPQRLQDTYKIKQYQVDNKLRQQAIVNSHAPNTLHMQYRGRASSDIGYIVCTVDTNGIVISAMFSRTL